MAPWAARCCCCSWRWSATRFTSTTSGRTGRGITKLTHTTASRTIFTSNILSPISTVNMTSANGDVEPQLLLHTLTTRGASLKWIVERTRTWRSYRNPAPRQTDHPVNAWANPGLQIVNQQKSAPKGMVLVYYEDA